MTIATFTRFIFVMLAALLAPAGAMARVRGFNRVQLWLFAISLQEMHDRGEKLRYPGETLATVYARIDLMAWICVDAFGAVRHLARRARGWRRARLANRAAELCAADAAARALGVRERGRRVRGFVVA